MIDDISLFDPRLLSQSLDNLPQNIQVRPLQLSDHGNGYDTILSQLSPATEPPLSLASFEKQFKIMASCDPKQYYVVVLVDKPVPAAGAADKETIVGTATLLVELKFIRSGALAGHIEDVVVAPTHQGLKLGQALISTLTGLAKKVGCYKIILDCLDHNVGFYEKCGYEKKGVEMKMYI